MTEQPTSTPSSTSLGAPSAIPFSSVSTQPSFGSSFSFGIGKNMQQSLFSQPTLTSKDTPATTTVLGTMSLASTGPGTGFQLTATPSSQGSLFAVSTSSVQPSASAPKPSFGLTFGNTNSFTTQTTPSTSTVASQPPIASLSTTTTSIAATMGTATAPFTFSTPGPTPSVPQNTGPTLSVKGPTMTYSQLEELINKWSHELEEQERYFLEEADRIVQWDQALILNGEKITTLYEKVDACKTEQIQLEQELDFIESQQRELDTLLEPLEKAANELPPGQLHSDFEREAIFQLAANVDLELDQLLSDLRDMADQVNAFTSRSLGDVPESKVSGDLKEQANTSIRAQNVSGGGPGAVQQVTRILNCHMHSLNWIHQNTQDLIERVKLLEGT